MQCENKHKFEELGVLITSAMKCPSLNDLPLPPHGKTGWPWTEESPAMPAKTDDGSPWPKISIVTPSLNQGQFIEETIRSILLQGYPNLEYIIIDGGSTDDSVRIIKKYEKWLTHWVSEQDCGQSHAINKGFAMSTGDIFAFINSDDLYEPNAFKLVAPLFYKQKNDRLVGGECIEFDENGIIDIYKPFWPQNLRLLMTQCPFAQPTSFWNSRLFQKTGGMDESLKFCFDMEFIIKIALHGITPNIINKRIARWRLHSESKSTTQSLGFQEEVIKIVKKHYLAFNMKDDERDKIIRNIQKAIDYLNVFLSWKNQGRPRAIINFLRMIAGSPNLVFRRNILGLARRLLFCKKNSVEEFKRF